MNGLENEQLLRFELRRCSRSSRRKGVTASYRDVVKAHSSIHTTVMRT
jgi:hypothetical protein